MLLAMAVPRRCFGDIGGICLPPVPALGWLAALLDFVRVAVTLGFLLAFLGSGGGTEGAAGVGRR